MDNGTYNAPAISFINDRNTGIYKIADGQMQFVSKVTLILRITNTGIMFAEGKDISFGGGTGTRLACLRSKDVILCRCTYLSTCKDRCDCSKRFARRGNQSGESSDYSFA